MSIWPLSFQFIAVSHHISIYCIIYLSVFVPLSLLCSVSVLWLVCPLQLWSSSPSSSPSVSFVICSSPPNPVVSTMAYPSQCQVSGCCVTAGISSICHRFRENIHNLHRCPVLNAFPALSVHFPVTYASEGSSNARPTSTTGPQGFRKHFLSRKLDCDNQPSDPDILFQRCFTANVTSVKVESPL